jgi:hypothetical protein
MCCNIGGHKALIRFYRNPDHAINKEQEETEKLHHYQRKLQCLSELSALTCEPLSTASYSCMLLQ